MIKRIIALVCVLITLVTCCVVSVGAEEVSEDMNIDIYSFPNEDVNIKAPLYYFTIRVGDSAPWLVYGMPFYQYRVESSAVITGHNGRWAGSGKYVGDINYTNDVDGTVENNLSFVQASGSTKHCIVSFGSGTYQDAGFLIKADGGVITEIRGLAYGASGLTFDAVTVAYSTYTYADVDNETNVTAFAIYLESLGIDQGFDKGLRTSGLLGWLFDGFSSAIVGLSSGIKSSATNLIYENGMTGSLSTVIQFIFISAGLSIAMTVFFLVFRLIRFGRQR